MAEKPAFRDAFARAALPGRRRRLLRVGEAPGRHDRSRGGSRAPTASRSPSPGCGRRGAGARDVEPLRTCTIVTTRTSRALAAHPRPHAGDAPARRPRTAWLDAATPVADLQDLCVPLEETGTRAVGTAVNDARYDGPDCLEPAPPPLTLF